MRIAIYARVSTKDKGQEVDNQLRQLEDYCRQRGWTVFAKYIDHETGKKSDRDQFRKLFADAARHRFDTVVFWALDRFTREGALPTLIYLNRLTERGITFLSFTEQYIDSCGMFKDVVIAILATIAKQESVRMSDRTIAGLERTRANGTTLGRRRLVVDRQKIATLRAQGRTCRAIASEMGISLGTLSRELKSLSQKRV